MSIICDGCGEERYWKAGAVKDPVRSLFARSLYSLNAQVPGYPLNCRYLYFCFECYAEYSTIRRNGASTPELQRKYPKRSKSK